MRDRRGGARAGAGAGRGRTTAAGRLGAVTLASAVFMGLGGGLPGPQALAAGTTGAAGAFRSASGAAGDPYAFAEGAQKVDGAVSTADAVRLETGRTYRSTLPVRGRAHYRLELDATSNTYVSATVVPPAGRTASVADGVRVSLQDGDGRSCDVDTASFGAARSPHPVAAWAVREISPRKSLCEEPGTYYATVERTDPDGEDSSPGPWELELTTASEPPLERSGATSAPPEWNSAPPRPVAGEPRRRPGGAGFARAAPLGEGVWRDDIRPGQTLFYKVPVDWGRQLRVTAELGGADTGGKGYVAAALDLDLYNPARGHVADVGVGYDGSQKSKALAPLPPVAHANRHDAGGRVRAVRFAGSYYLVAHLAAKVADRFGDGPVPLTLRVGLSGAAQDGPGYAGEAVPRDVFTVTEEDREAAAGDAAGDGTAMRALAVGGIGGGSALLAGLGVWTLVARRRTAPRAGGGP